MDLPGTPIEEQPSGGTSPAREGALGDAVTGGLIPASKGGRAPEPLGSPNAASVPASDAPQMDASPGLQSESSKGKLHPDRSAAKLMREGTMASMASSTNTTGTMPRRLLGASKMTNDSSAISLQWNTSTATGVTAYRSRAGSEISSLHGPSTIGSGLRPIDHARGGKRKASFATSLTMSNSTTSLNSHSSVRRRAVANSSSDQFLVEVDKSAMSNRGLGGCLSRALSYMLRSATRLVRQSEEVPAETNIKVILLMLSTMCLLAGIGWGLLYIFSGAEYAAVGPAVFSAFMPVGIVILLWKKTAAVPAVVFLLSMALCCGYVHVALGGFAASGFVLNWTVLVPVGVLMMSNDRRLSWLIFIFYCAFVISMALMTEYEFSPFRLGLDSEPSQMAAFAVHLLDLMNILAPSFCLMGAVTYFYTSFKKQEESHTALLHRVYPADVVEELERSQHVRMMLESPDSARHGGSSGGKNGPAHSAQAGGGGSHQQGVLAYSYDDIGVLFLDLCNFTSWAGRLEPEEMLGALAYFFAEVDKIVAKYPSCEKVKTIGDAYMAISGRDVPDMYAAGALSEEQLDEHLLNLVMCGLEIQKLVQTRKMLGHRLKIRVGVAVGPVVAGVVSTLRASFDVFGDTVNMASRMESTAAPGQVHVSEEVWARVGGLPNTGLAAEDLGYNQVKGKGQQRSFNVLHVASELVQARKHGSNTSLLRSASGGNLGRTSMDNATVKESTATAGSLPVSRLPSGTVTAVPVPEEMVSSVSSMTPSDSHLTNATNGSSGRKGDTSRQDGEHRTSGPGLTDDGATANELLAANNGSLADMLSTGNDLNPDDEFSLV